jgi:hypothetical protein
LKGRAGVLAALMRQDWVNPLADFAAWPRAFHDSRRWCFLMLKPCTDPISALVQLFLRLCRHCVGLNCARS